MQQHPTRRAPDYTDAFLVSFGVLLFMGLWMITALLGFVWAVGLAYGFNRLLRRHSMKNTG